MTRTYDRRDLIEVYLGSLEQGYGDYYSGATSYNAALKVYYVDLRDALERRFNSRLGVDGDTALRMLFHSTVASLLAIRTPWSGFVDAGLLNKRLEDAGENGERVNAASGRIAELTAQTREAHLEMLDALVVSFTGVRADLTVSEDDLRAEGVECTPPDTSGYDLFEDY
ncbi:hypothetical protein [Actinoplanes friuliensis]|jgi:hypothetical protein|uniref:Uncharacterized protein n=1 Tax=Actinoplanes friuliensis DSM 7358 TaxID=1246995 RepID=U5WBI3_9ACTN|nr:hypothetical protein [Actinoplanes friuliensis]AGZ45350.1 hypothetical protein AFR_35470 [Actinoplanes friuliensis DSM 7358]